MREKRRNRAAARVEGATALLLAAALLLFPLAPAASGEDGAASAPAAVAPAGAPAAGEPDARLTPPADAWSVRGRLDLRYVFRTTVGSHAEDDNDLFQDWFVETRKGSTFRAEASGRFHEDIGGTSSPSTFRDSYDTYGEPAQGFLYTAYGEMLELGGALARVRVGRQYYAEGVEVRFDGGLVETEALGDAVRLVAYGGSPVNIWEASRAGDWIAGGAAELVAIPRTTVRLDYVHLTDMRPDRETYADAYGIIGDEVRDDDFFLLAVNHQVIPELRIRAEGSTFEGRSSRAMGEALFNDEELGLTSRLRYVLQMGAYRDLALQFTPLDDQLGAYEPYNEGHADIRKRIIDELWLGGGFAIRQLLSDSDQGPYNHEFYRLFGLADTTDLPWRGLSLSARTDYYRSDVKDRTFQLSFDATQELDAFVIGAGTSYALFRFDPFYVEEREDVRTYYGNAEWKPTNWLRFRLTYSYEIDDEDEYHVVRCDARLTF